MVGPGRNVRLLCFGALLGAGLLGASPTKAQEAAPEQVAPAPALSAEEQEARERFRQGLSLARDGDCRGALAELRASLALLERPNTLYNIARCEQELFRYDLAVQAHERYLEIAPEDAEDRATVEGNVRSLQALLGVIDVESNVPAQVWVGDRQVGEAPGRVLVPGGRHALELRADGYLPARQEVEVAGGQQRQVQFSLERAEMNVTNVEENTVNITEDGGAPPAVFYSALGLTLATAAAGGVFGVLALQSESDAEGADPLDRSTIDEANDATSQRAAIADVFFGVAGALAVTTVVLGFLTDFDGDADSREGVETSAWISPGSAGVQVGGRF